MKKLYIILSLLLILSGCQNKVDDTKLQVVTSFYPIYDLTQTITNNRLNVRNIAPLSLEVHDFEPTPQDIASLETASLLVVHGNHLEGWLESTLEAINNKDLKVLILSDYVTLLDDDNHSWLSIDNMIEYSMQISQSLSEIDPDGAASYEANQLTWAQEASELMTEFSYLYDNQQQYELVVDHMAYSYLVKDLNMTQRSITGGQLASDLSAKALKDIIDHIKVNETQVIYKDEESSPNLFTMLNSETGVEVETLYTLEVMSIEDYKPYLEMMRMNLEAIGKVVLND